MQRQLCGSLVICAHDQCVLRGVSLGIKTQIFELQVNLFVIKRTLKSCSLAIFFHLGKYFTARNNDYKKVEKTLAHCSTHADNLANIHMYALIGTYPPLHTHTQTQIQSLACSAYHLLTCSHCCICSFHFYVKLLLLFFKCFLRLLAGANGLLLLLLLASAAAEVAATAVAAAAAAAAAAGTVAGADVAAAEVAAAAEAAAAAAAVAAATAVAVVDAVAVVAAVNVVPGVASCVGLLWLIY